MLGVMAVVRSTGGESDRARERGERPDAMRGASMAANGGQVPARHEVCGSTSPPSHVAAGSRQPAATGSEGVMVLGQGRIGYRGRAGGRV